MEKLKQYRLDNNYTYQQVAEGIGINRSFYWQIENEKRRLTYSLAVRLADFFEVTPDQLFYNDMKEKLNIPPINMEHK